MKTYPLIRGTEHVNPFSESINFGNFTCTEFQNSKAQMRRHLDHNEIFYCHPIINYNSILCKPKQRIILKCSKAEERRDNF